MQPQLAPANRHVALLELRPRGPQRLDLGAQPARSRTPRARAAHSDRTRSGCSPRPPPRPCAWRPVSSTSNEPSRRAAAASPCAPRRDAAPSPSSATNPNAATSPRPVTSPNAATRSNAPRSPSAATSPSAARRNPTPAARPRSEQTRPAAPSHRPRPAEVHPAARRVDPLDAHRDRIPQPQRRPGALAPQDRALLVELPPLARRSTRRPSAGASTARGAPPMAPTTHRPPARPAPQGGALIPDTPRAVPLRAAAASTRRRTGSIPS